MVTARQVAMLKQAAPAMVASHVRQRCPASPQILKTPLKLNGMASVLTQKIKTMETPG